MSGKKIKVLVVDDDGFIRDVLTSILEDGNYGVVTAGDGMEAFAKFLKDDEIALVISDMNMPGMSGMELTAKIRERASDVPVMILTADEEMSSVPALESGVNRFLLKDESLQERVIMSVEEVIGKNKQASRAQ